MKDVLHSVYDHQEHKLKSTEAFLFTFKDERYLQRLYLLAKCQDLSKRSQRMLLSHLQPWQPEFCLKTKV